MSEINSNHQMPDKTISTESLQQVGRTFPPSPEVVQRAHVNAEQYHALYQRSLREPKKFWLEQAHSLEWFTPPKHALKFTWDTHARKVEHRSEEHTSELQSLRHLV